ncbi:hypothetical protein [Romboutsia maritimum]|uniref:hypothetical protein n=1 Tax=Romboutsia maritimum TaxID=2020948 RepID=UPI001313E45F|nr:hypothetical protein [Romboutsia maritimum]
MKITIDIELKELLGLGNISNYRNTMSCKTSINPKSDIKSVDIMKNEVKEIEKVIYKS